MRNKYRLHAWVDVGTDDGPLDVDQVRQRLHQALSVGDTDINVACEGPIREDHGR